jgi:hypothetical protein
MDGKPENIYCGLGENKKKGIGMSYEIFLLIANILNVCLFGVFLILVVRTKQWILSFLLYFLSSFTELGVCLAIRESFFQINIPELSFPDFIEFIIRRFINSFVISFNFLGKGVIFMFEQFLQHPYSFTFFCLLLVFCIRYLIKSFRRMK